MEELLETAAVGARVRVYWEGDDAWFEGVVREHSAERGYYVEYDDGEEQWEAVPRDYIEVLSSNAVDSRLILAAEAAEDDENDANDQYEEGEGSVAPQGATKWSAEPPPSTQPSSPTAYDDDEYENDEDHDAHDATKKARSPVPQQQSPVRRPAAARQPRDPAKYIKSGVFFKDPESLRDTKAALQRERQELTRQYDRLAATLQEKEVLSRSLKRELHGLKAVVSVGVNTGNNTTTSRAAKPKTARDWMQRLAEQKAEHRKSRQALASLQSELHEATSKVTQLEATRGQLQTRLDRVPKRELSTLVEIQMEIAQRIHDKHVLETDLAKTPAVSNVSTASKRPEHPGDEKTVLERELRVLDKTLTRVSDEADEWRQSYDRENARIAPLQARVARLQQQLQQYEASQVLLRSVFLRMDRQGTGSISHEAAEKALRLLAASNDQDGAIHAAVNGGETTGELLTFAQFTHLFKSVFPAT